VIRVLIAFAAMLLTGGVMAAAQTQPTTDPTSAPVPTATTEPAEPSVATLIGQLGDPDPRLRDAASKTLWSRGRTAAEPLTEAAASDNPEVSRRAKSILRDFTYGLYPDAPREIFSLLDEYRKGDPQEKRIAIWRLGSNNAGIPGIRLLIKLREEERDPNLKQMISQVLLPREHDVVVLMMADGQAADVEQILASSAFDSDSAAQDYAALLLETGKLPRKLAELKLATINARSAPVVVALARAAGDAATARAAAMKSDRPELLDAVLTEQEDWPALATRLAADPHGLEPVERLGYLCAFHRLAGDKKRFADDVQGLITLSEQSPQDYSQCAEDLFLNGQPDAALKVLMDHKDYLQASNFFAPRLQFREALELPALADQHQPGEAIKIKARTIATYQFVGEIEKAKVLMATVAAENAVRNDFATWVYLVEGARQLGMTSQADEYAATALEKAGGQDPTGWLFEKMQLGDGSSARLWWQFLRSQHAALTTTESIKRLRDIIEGNVPGPELEALAESARRFAADLPAGEREAWEQNLIDTLKRGGLTETASKWVDAMAADGSASPSMLIFAGDIEADRKNWSAAAVDYAKAFERDHTSAVAMFLHGWALQQSGHDPEGRAMMESAHRLPLGNESARHALLDEMRRHKLGEDVAREAELILKATAPRSWDRSDALRTMAEDAARKGDYLAAADDWEQAFLQNLSSNTSFAEPWANAIVPALIHKTRAIGLIGAGKVPEALSQAAMSLDETPGDADALIELVNAFDKAGRAEDAQSFFAERTQIFRNLIQTYPRSGPGFNQLAWAQVMCNRELDDALKNAKRAVELEPTSTASLDTLAEVYFARHDAPDAIAQMKRCVELEPHVERHRRQLARFEGQPGASTRPD
jgi:tetratricopeptide (TPR) repeat protein